MVQPKRAMKPGDSSAALMEGLDAISQRAINDETDRIFFETQDWPRGKRLPGASHPLAIIWLSIRDGVVEAISADPADRPPPPPELEEAEELQRERHLGQIEAHMKQTLRLKDEEVDRLLLYTDNNAMAEEQGKEAGARKLLDALEGRSSLGPLGPAAKEGLVLEFALNWLYSPGDNEDGARENLEALTTALKADAVTAKMVAMAFNRVRSTVPGQAFVGSNYDELAGQRNIQAALWDAAVDLDATGTVTASQDGVKIAIHLLGQNRWSWIPGSRWDFNPDRYGQWEPTPSVQRRNAVINAVARGALSDAETDRFFDRIFNSSSAYDVSPRDSLFGTFFDYDTSSQHEQESMGKLLGYVANLAHARNEQDAAFNTANMIEIMKSKGGREVLFSTSMPNEYRLWAMDMMSADSADPGKKPWTAKDLDRGWESPVVAEAYAAAAVKYAEASFAQRWQVDATADRGAMINAIGQVLNLKPDKLPGNESEADKRKREIEGFNHPIYDDDEDPMKQLLEHIGTGSVSIVAVPVVLMNREEGGAPFWVLRIQKEGTTDFFLDDKGHRYGSFVQWKEDNELPPGAMTYPKDLMLGNPLETARSPRDSAGSRVLDVADKAAMAVGAVAGVVILIGSGGTAAPLLATAAAAYAGTRAVQRLAHMHALGHDVTDLRDDEIRGAYIEVFSNAFAVGSFGSARLFRGLTAEGARISRTGANLIAGLNWAGNITDAAGLADQINNLASQWEKMDEGERSKALVSLGFAVGMKAASVKQGGGLREQFDLKRIRNQIEHGTPFSVELATANDNLNDGETVAVRYDNGRVRIVYKDKFPDGEVLALHSDAAVSIEASFTLKARLKRMMGGLDVDNPPAGSVAWEAVEELKKIRKELDRNLSKMNGADEGTRQELAIRQIELNEAILREHARLDYWDQPGRGAVASPATGGDQARQLGWDQAERPAGYQWIAGADEPYLVAPGKEKLYYNPRTKSFISEARRARLEIIADRAGDAWFDRTFDTSTGPVDPLPPDMVITAKKGGMPSVAISGRTKAEVAQDLSTALGLESGQLEVLTELMGKRVSREFGEAWKRAVATSEPASEALQKIRVRESLAAAAEHAGDVKRAEALRKQASKLGKDAYDPVRSEFWKQVHADPALRARIEAAGLTFKDGKAPFLRAPDPARPGKFIEMQVTLEHFQRKSDVPSRAQDADNLLFSFRYENTVILEHIRRIVRMRMGVNPGQPHPMN